MNVAAEAHNAYTIETLRPDYAERCIRKLTPTERTHMAKLALAGYRLSCGERTPIGNRWWLVRFEGRHISGLGGLALRDVLRRTLQSYQMCKEIR